MLNQHFILGYRNSEPWYGVHPLLHDGIWSHAPN